MRTHGLLALVLIAGCDAGSVSPPDAVTEESVATAPAATPDEMLDDSLDDSLDETLEDPLDDLADPADDLAADDDDGALDETAVDEADDLAADPATDLDDDGIDVGDDEATDIADDDAAADDDPEAIVDAAPAAIPTPIKYILVIVKENHTFDNYFTGFPGAESSTHAFKLDKHHHRVKFLRPKAPNGRLGDGPGHTHHAALAAYRNGHMDGFGVNPGKWPYIRYTKQQLPNYWKYASHFVLADHLFSTTLGPSSPGHEVFWFGRSTSLDNPKCHRAHGKGCSSGCLGNHLTITTFNETTGKTRKVAPCFDLPSLPDHLPSKFTWFNYGGRHAMQIKSQRHVSVAKHYGSTGKLLTDLRQGKLHNLMIAHVTGGVSEHPPESPCAGERYTTEVVNAAMKLPEWKHMAIIVTWDDWGGFYDHVKPPVRKARNGARFGSGFRLPLIIMSPYAKHGVVLHHNTEQASVPRLVEELWGMSFMTTRNKHARDGVAGSLLGAFDFTQTPRAPLHLTPQACH